MHYRLTMPTLVLAIAGGAFALPALAQWEWLDKDGRKTFSDRAPPAGILDKNILKRPENKSPGPGAPGAFGETVPVPAAARASAPVPSAGTPKPLGRSSELEIRRKQAADLERVQKQLDAEKLASAKADNCERARSGQASLLSGVRMSVVNAKGEREFMDDNVRLSEARRLQAIADSDCIK